MRRPAGAFSAATMAHCLLATAGQRCTGSLRDMGRKQVEGMPPAAGQPLRDRSASQALCERGQGRCVGVCACVCVCAMAKSSKAVARVWSCLLALSGTATTYPHTDSHIF